VNWNEVARRWQDFAGAARETWSKLTDDDIKSVAGDREKLAAKLQELYGFEKARALKSIDEFVVSVGRNPPTPP
jgi:uncharacterized protein YjbJ (UPF0337 family)